MRWLLRRSGGGTSKLGLNEFRRTVVSSCRAVLLPRFGGPEALELREDVKIPDLKPNEVLVRARAVSINPLDCRVSSRLLFICMHVFWNAYRFFISYFRVKINKFILMFNWGGGCFCEFSGIKRYRSLFL